jgi:hypothetical protein
MPVLIPYGQPQPTPRHVPGRTFTIRVDFTRDDGREASRSWTRFGSITQALEDGAAYARTEIAVGSRIRLVHVSPAEG